MTTKTCIRCRLTKPLDDFNNSTKSKDGKNYYCRLCSRAKQRETYLRNAEARREAERLRRATWDPAERAAYERRRRDARLVKRFMLEPEGYDAMLAAQGGGCALCGRQPDPHRALAVDHDHACCPGDSSCGCCLRGLLCHLCNTHIGIYEAIKNNPERLAATEAYLNRVPERTGRL